MAVELELAIVALLLAGYALIARSLDRRSIPSALAFVAVGLLASEEVFGLISLHPEAEPVQLLAEAALTLLLFADASSIRTRALRRDAAVIGRLLIVGLLLTIVVGTFGALLLFPGISLGIAMLIGAALAPTDAALGQPVVTNSAVPARIRRVLNVESGLNDGIATPFVFLALALATAEATTGGGWLAGALTDMAIGVGVGIGLGVLGGSLLRLADRKGWTTPVSRQLFVLALAVACYLLAIGLGGNGFIAAFVGGLAFAFGTDLREENAVRFTETQGDLLAIGVWTAFGLTMAGELWAHLGNIQVIVYALLSLTVIRMAPVAIALAGTRLQPLTIAFVGWFGPRGLASIVFLFIGLEGLRQAGVDSGPLAPTIAWTVLLSVILHGLTAGPLAARYGRRMIGLPATAPEHEAEEVPDSEDVG